MLMRSYNIHINIYAHKKGAACYLDQPVMYSHADEATDALGAEDLRLQGGENLVLELKGKGFKTNGCSSVKPMLFNIATSNYVFQDS